MPPAEASKEAVFAAHTPQIVCNSYTPLEEQNRLTAQRQFLEAHQEGDQTIHENAGTSIVINHLMTKAGKVQEMPLCIQECMCATMLHANGEAGAIPAVHSCIGCLAQYQDTVC